MALKARTTSMTGIPMQILTPTEDKQSDKHEDTNKDEHTGRPTYKRRYGYLEEESDGCGNAEGYPDTGRLP